MAPDDRTPPNNQQDAEAAGGGPAGVGYATYAEAAERLLDNGYEPLPIKPRSKAPIPKRWTRVTIDAARVEIWARAFPKAGIGLRTGGLVGFDLDVLDPALADAAYACVLARLGPAPMRVGLWPKRLLIYRTAVPFERLSIPQVEVLGLGQQFVASGIHPDLDSAYYWPLGDTPFDTPLAELPLVDRAACEETLTELAAILPAQQRRSRKPEHGEPRGHAGAGMRSDRDASGRVVDGRDAWLSWLAFDGLHAALDAGESLDPLLLADRVWAAFVASTDLAREKGAGGGAWSAADALRKVRDKLCLHQDGLLPPRKSDRAEPPKIGPFLPLEEARRRLDARLGEVCLGIAEWHRSGEGDPAPRVGIRATVGLGKSVAARCHIDQLRSSLSAQGLPSRILYCTPSHALAEEAAAAWSRSGAHVAVWRGYEARDPNTGNPMCRDIEAVRLALLAGLDVQTAACKDRSGATCAFFAGCAKQRNREEVAAADVVVAPYDVLFTGFAQSAEQVAALVIDEACWGRAVSDRRGLYVETLPHDMINLWQKRPKIAAFDDAADLHDLRSRLAGALGRLDAAPLGRSDLEGSIDVEAARLAIVLEKKRLRLVMLRPGMSRSERKAVEATARLNARAMLYVALWDAVERLLGQEADTDGRIRVCAPDPKTGLTEIIVLGVKALDEALAGLPILHLDATLRPQLAEAVLPDLSVTEIEAAAPHQHLRLVNGAFGKGALCEEPGRAEAENRRRAHKLRDCVDYVRWQARRFPGKRTLVITYLACEAAFASIPEVSVAHFNAIAGLDAHRDVALLVVLGRPLPPDVDLVQRTAALFGHAATGSYRAGSAAVALARGGGRLVRTRVHDDPAAEALRSAICDDEVIQAIGRGRGVNRTIETPLEVHVLANVALPLPHAAIQRWETVVPDIVQRMLLASVAVDSPMDAAALHPALFANAEQAKHALARSAFKGQTPSSISYRGLSLKSAAYRRPGKGRSWQRAYWIDGDAADAKAALEQALGPLAEWRPE